MGLLIQRYILSVHTSNLRKDSPFRSIRTAFAVNLSMMASARVGVQAAVDAKHKLIVHYEATNTNDRKAVFPMAMEVKKVCHKERLRVLADKGYHNGEQLQQCRMNGIVTYVAWQEVNRSIPVPTAPCFGERFIYDPVEDQYICPAGHLMKTTGKWYTRKYRKTSETQVNISP